MTEIIFDKSEDWENRILCSDESCIGTVGADGKCQECGKAYKGILPERTAENTVQSATVQEVEERADDMDDEWDKRTLCRDETCIGVIGHDGKCKECGKPFTQE